MKALFLPLVLATGLFAAENNAPVSFSTVGGKVYTNATVLKADQSGLQVRTSRGLERIKYSDIAAEELERIAPSIPGTLVLNNGRTYLNARLQQKSPDGVTVEHTPGSGGIGVVKIPFEDLPADMQSKMRFNAEEAAAYRARRGEAEQLYREQVTQRENAIREAQENEMKKQTQEAQVFRQEVQKQNEIAAKRAHQSELQKQNLENAYQREYLRSEALRSRNPDIIIYGPAHPGNSRNRPREHWDNEHRSPYIPRKHPVPQR